MLLKTLKSNPSLQFILLLSISIILGIKPLHDSGIANPDAWTWILFNLTASIGCGWIITQRKLSRNSGLIAMLALCMFSAITPVQISGLPWGCFFFLAAQYHILNIYATDKPYPAIFNAGMFWSAVTLLHPELTFTIPCLWIIMISYSLNQWREWLASLLGISVPYILVAALNYSKIIHYEFQWTNMMAFGFPSISELPIPTLILFLVGTVLSGFSIGSLRKYLQDLEINERKKSSALIVLFIYTLIFTLSTQTNLANRFCLIFPLSFFCTKFFVNSGKSLYNEIGFAVMILLCILGVYFS